MKRARRIEFFLIVWVCCLVLCSDSRAQSPQPPSFAFVPGTPLTIESATVGLVGRGLAIALDPVNVHIAYYNLGNIPNGIAPTVKYATFQYAPCQGGGNGGGPISCSPTPLTIETVATLSLTANTQNAMSSISIAVDPASVPHIVYADGLGGLYYASQVGGAWTEEFITSGAGTYNSLAIDKTGTPHVAYGDVGYATRSNGVWTTESTFLGATTLTGMSISVDSHGIPQIVVGVRTDEVLWAQRGTGPLFWITKENVNTFDAQWVSMAIDQNDTPHVAYLGWPGAGSLSGETDYATRIQPGFWQLQFVDSFDVPCCFPNPWGENMVALALSPQGAPSVVYATDSGVQLSRPDVNGVWTPQPVPEANLAFVALAVDANDNAHLLYRGTPPGGTVSVLYFEIPNPNSIAPNNTPVSNPPGTPVTVPLQAAGGNTVSVTFSSVTQAGQTTVTDMLSNGTCPAAPLAVSFAGNPPICYDISTTAVVTPPIKVCIDYKAVTDPSTLGIYHYENGIWVDSTTSSSGTTNGTVCGTVNSLSPFALFQNAHASLTITASNVTRLYGAPDPTPFPVTYSGFLNGDGPSVLSGQLSCTSTDNPSSPIGTYMIDCSGSTLSSPKYVITYVSGTLSVTPAPLTLSADNQHKTYGAPVPALTFSANGFVNGDTAASLTTQPMVSTSVTPATGVGTYAIAIGGAVDSNYTISYVPGTLIVNPAMLTITADNKSRPYGARNPAFSGSVSGLQNGDSVTLGFSTSATSSSPVGQYAIVPSPMAAVNVLNNYVVTPFSGTLTVLPETTSLTVTISPASITIGQSATITVTLTAPDLVIPFDPAVLVPVTVSSPIVSDILSNASCTPVASSNPGIASCSVTLTAIEPNGRSIAAAFAGSPNLLASSAESNLTVTAPLESKVSCIKSDFRNVAVPGGSYIWFNSILNLNDWHHWDRDDTTRKVTVTFFQSSVQFQYPDGTGNLVVVNQAMPDAKIVFDPGVTTPSTTYDGVNHVWLTTLPFDTDDAAFLSGMPWQVPSGGIPADIEPVTWCGTFASDTANVEIGWRWAAATYSTFSNDNTVLGVKPMNSDRDNPADNRDNAGTPENFKQYVVPGARGKGGRNYTGNYSGDGDID